MNDAHFMRLALRLARRGYGATSPNPMVGAVLVKSGKIIGRGWHHRAGLPHAEIEALRDAERRGNNPKGATLYVTLEPCCTHGRTPPCTEAIKVAGIKRVVVGTIDPNPHHAGKGFRVLKQAGIEVVPMDGKGLRSVPAGSTAPKPRARSGAPAQKLAVECSRLNEAFNHWIVHRRPFVTVKAAMTLDGKIATASGESQWITGPEARSVGMKLRQGSDAILVGVNTVLLDDPSLTVRSDKSEVGSSSLRPRLRRIVLDSQARTPLTAKIVTDDFAALTTLVVADNAPQKRVDALAKRVAVLVAPRSKTKNQTSKIDLRWLLKKLGSENVASLLVEGGGEVNASFLMGGFAHRVAFFYAPKILGGRNARKAVAGDGAASLAQSLTLSQCEWREVGDDLLMTALVDIRPKR